MKTHHKVLTGLVTFSSLSLTEGATGLNWIDANTNLTLYGDVRLRYESIGIPKPEWAEGRDFDLYPKSAQRPDLVIRGWVEIDGKPYPGFQRTVNFTAEPVPKRTVALTR